MVEAHQAGALMLTQYDLEAINAFRGERYLATTLYLPLDVGQPPQFPVLLRDLAKRTRAAGIDDRGLPHDVAASARQDLADLERHVTAHMERAGARGISVFCCSAEGWWRTWLLPLPPPARLIQETSFYLRPLALMLDQYRPIMLVLLDRRHARIFEIRMGGLEEYRDVVDDVPARVREGGFQGYAERSVRGHVEDHEHRHFENVAAKIFDLFGRHGFEWLILGGAGETLSYFVACLHPYVWQRLRATLNMPLGAPFKDVVAVAQEAERQIKSASDEELLSRVREGLSPGGRAVSGLGDTLQLLAQGRVNTLLVQPGLALPGIWCPRCRLLVPDHGPCPLGCGEAAPVEDVVDEAVGLALDRGTRVVHVEAEFMTRLGGMAAILR
ncbi:MAG: hypothetical protein V2A77_01235 [Pseudomonadota bacterium]